MLNAKKIERVLMVFALSTLFVHEAYAGSPAHDGRLERVYDHSTTGHHNETDDAEVVGSAGPRTPSVRILQVRPYVNQGANPGKVFIEVDQVSVCNTSVYSIDMSKGGSKEAYATVLAAFVVDKPVVLELVNSGCTGSGTKIQSVFLNR